MHTLIQLKQLQERMLEELNQLPQYRAMKAMDQFIHELSNIYGEEQIAEGEEFRKQISAAVESRIAPSTVGVAPPKITPYVPAHRVA